MPNISRKLLYWRYNYEILSAVKAFLDNVNCCQLRYNYVHYFVHLLKLLWLYRTAFWCSLLQGRGRREVERDSRALKTRPHSVHFPQQNGGEQDSDKENQVGGRGRGRGQGGDSQVITASTWLSNILPAPKEDGIGPASAREQSPSPQHKALVQVLFRLHFQFRCFPFKSITLYLALNLLN